MVRPSLLVGVISVLLSQTAASPQTPLQPPVAKQVEHQDVRHGETVVDEYYWLREKQNPEVIQYLEAENAYTEAMTKNLKGFEDALYKEMLGRIKQTDLSVPERQGGYFYYSRTEEGKRMEAPEEVLLDLNQMAQGLKFLALGAFEVSDDGNLLAYSTDTTGFRQYHLHIKDLRTGQVLPDTAERVT
jgi:oligopeptidase B